MGLPETMTNELMRDTLTSLNVLKSFEHGPLNFCSQKFYDKEV